MQLIAVILAGIGVGTLAYVLIIRSSAPIPAPISKTTETMMGRFILSYRTLLITTGILYRSVRRALTNRERKNGMADVRNIAPRSREELEKIVVRLLAIVDRCDDHAIQYDLRQLSDELTRIIDAIVE